VAILVDGSTVPAAIARTIDLFAAAPVDLVGIHVQPPARRRSLGARLAGVADRADRTCFRPAPDAFRPIALDLTHGDRMSARSERAWLADLGDLDVLLDLTTDGLVATDPAGARLGTWSLRHGDWRLPLSRASFARAFALGSEVAITELVADGEAPAAAPRAQLQDARVLYRSVGVMDDHSPVLTRDAAACNVLRHEPRRWTDRSAER
jgi:hypothetical protein